MGNEVSGDGAALHHRVKPPPWWAVSEIYSKTIPFVAKNQAMQIPNTVLRQSLTGSAEMF